jgi:hypothetical protein
MNLRRLQLALEVAIATGYGLDDRGSILGRGKIFCSSSRRSDRLWDQIIQWLPVAFPLRLKRSGQEADRSPPFSVYVKNDEAVTSPPHTSLWRDA